MKIVFRPLGVALLALAVAGCAGGSVRPIGGSASVTVIDAAELPGPDGQLGTDQRYIYTIGPYDKLIIDVLGFEELRGRRVQVDGSGNISLPIAGVVSVAGLTMEQAIARVREQMRAGYVRDPQIGLNLEESLSQYVTVDGEVDQPGNYPIVAQMTLMRAVAAARGTTELARLRDVVIHRQVRGQQMIALYNLDAIRRGAYPDPIVYPQDTIVVGESSGRRALMQALQVAPLFISPIIALVDRL